MNFDYIIVGAGSAGCALTHELMKSGHKVLVLEAGGSDRSPFIKIPACIFQAIKRYDWGYEAQPDPTRNGKIERSFRGRVLGGSSSINGMKFARPAAADLDHWSALCGHVGGWSGRELMPILRGLETSDQHSALRGKEGPLSVRTIKRPHPITDAFIQSACTAGHRFNSDYNGDSEEGVAYAQLTQRRGLRCSAADAFLRPHLGNKDLTLLLNALVHKIEVENGRAVALVYLHRGQIKRATAGRIVLSAGVFNSPKLLMLSGIGNPVELERHNIDVVLDLPGVGRRFQEQQFLRPGYRSKIPTYNPTQGLRQKLSIVGKFLFHREGPICSLYEGHGALKSSEAECDPDIRLTFYPILYLHMPDGSHQLAPYPGVMLSLTKCYPKSRGQIRLASKNPSDAPIIEYDLLESREDVDTLIRGIRAVRRIMGSDPIATLLQEEVVPGPHVQDDTSLEAFVRKYTSVPQNAVGSCRMGVDGDAVVGPDLRVRGMENLWIADGSIMPDHVGHDTNATCMMIGAKLGREFCRE